METMKLTSKSTVMYQISKAFDTEKDVSGEWVLKKSGTLVNVKLTFSKPETFTDANGVKWVRAFECDE